MNPKAITIMDEARTTYERALGERLCRLDGWHSWYFDQFDGDDWNTVARLSSPEGFGAEFHKSLDRSSLGIVWSGFVVRETNQDGLTGPEMVDATVTVGFGSEKPSR